VKKYPKFHNNEAKNIYTWHKVCFFTSWTAQGKIRILCFDLPSLLQEAITHSVREVSELSKERLGALALNNILVEETVSLFEKCLWNWRDVVRDLEQVCPLTPLTNYPNFFYFILLAENVLLDVEPTRRHRRRTPRSRLHQATRNSPPYNPLLGNYNRGNRDTKFNAEMLLPYPPLLLGC
jgi:hypothetical protein